MPDFKNIFQIAKKAFAELNEHNPLQLASSTAFFSLFALPPILILLIALLGLVLKQEELSNTIFQRLAATIGESGSEQIQEIFDNFRGLADDTLTTVLVGLFLLFIATNLFVMVRKNLNALWNIKPKKATGILPVLRARLFAMAQLIIGGGVIIVAIILDAAVTCLGEGLDQLCPDLDLPVIKVINGVLSVGIVSLWFMLLYKILPNAKINWNPALVGGFITSLLFTLGKYLIGFALVNSNLDNIFGASGSIILVLLFIFYSALIFYYGAAITKNYGDYIGQPIEADEISVKVE